ncbi:hypothetical protein WJ0W_004076 [Paenibacillus melissococcoides]|uniref:Tail fiber protein n=1 Tax=Paenibacillus melissococcoides TaxID=2912268 RepID=A0ABN8U6Z6_9BACL|nr:MULTISPECIES: hypothetical protein [Paenibacillus]GIO81934.1 hypothetical protein J6TS7_55440 [Paenibacillus dendritiformis]CAH8246844.1 hypothetical protein WJ0W_004076 [Paenibacillus melissococcoides]CAH8715927.1 hypothetical protein HTL2_004446 [Paenibacillus melissococcoides]CAH8716881.1 hypothetical protein WDD9_004713 [Paenibacillus melissococcoides]
MANRYCNLVGSKKISEDFQNINIGFDKVQQDMDSKSSGDHRHPNATDTTDGFMSAQDKAKMDASTASATPGTLAQRDASGRMKTAAPSAKTDVARKAEVDAVQADLDSHKADAVMHVTAEDHEKLGSIEEGAEVNQPAFSKVNDIEAGEKTDALTFKGGVGIKITTNPNTNEVTFTASGDSTPGDHGSSHTEHGADPIPNATAKEGGLMSAVDKAEFDKLAAEVPMQGAELERHDKQLKEHAAELEDHEQRIDGIEAGMADVPGTPLELRPGLQVVESEQDTPFRMGEIKGRTLLNLNGKDGNFDYRGLLPTFFGTGEIIPASTPVGTKVQKIVCNRAADSPGHFGARYELNIDRSKHYVAVAYLDNISCDEPVYFSFAEWKSTGYYTIRKSGNVKKGEGMVFRYVSISPTDMSSIQEKLIFYFRGEGTADAEFRIGAFALYEITQAEYEAIGGTNFDYVAERYPYVDSMTNVTNPYAIVTGGNLLPPFYEADRITVASKATVVAPYELRFGAGGDGDFLAYHLSVLPNQTYVFSLENSGVSWCITELDYNTFVVPYGTDTYRSFNVGSRTQIALVLKSFSADIDVSCKNPMLTVGTEAKPFVPQQRSMIAFETELAAHPVDGSNPDILFMGDDGLPYVLEAWGKVALEPSNFENIAQNANLNGFKQIAMLLKQKDTSSISRLIKFDGTQLILDLNSVPLTEPDSYITSSEGNLWVTIPNTDSGWGPDYTPTADEIKAYFLGWRMAENITGFPLYNGTGTKCWYKINTNSAPQTAQPTESYPEWTPYRLQYLKAKPTVEPVRNYELGATLSAGSNMVEVGSGIVIRERANPAPGVSDEGNINNAYLPATMLRHRTRVASAIVYKNNAIDRAWIAKGDNVLQTEPSYYDPTAVYHVTYTMLDPTLAAPISGTVAANLRGTVSDLVQDVGDIGRRLSVVETQKAEKDVAGWIQATLLNNWTPYDLTNYLSASYYKDSSGIVYVDGMISGGSVTPGTLLFRLPKGYRPRMHKMFSATSSDGDIVSPAAIVVSPDGSVTIIRAVSSVYLALSAITFLAEQ